MPKLAIALTALQHAGCAGSANAPADQVDAKSLAKIVEGYQPVGTTDCVDPNRVNYSETVRGGIVYRSVTGGKIYINHIAPQCFTPNGDDILVSYPFAGRYCKGDRVEWVARFSRVRSGFCVLGDFTEYQKAKSPAS